MLKFSHWRSKHKEHLELDLEPGSFKKKACSFIIFLEVLCHERTLQALRALRDRGAV